LCYAILSKREKAKKEKVMQLDETKEKLQYCISQSTNANLKVMPKHHRRNDASKE
jgi:hypothetical protein